MIPLEPRGPRLSEDEFRLLRELIEQHCGIWFRDDLAYVLERRLWPRLEVLGLPDFSAYHRHLRLDPDRHAELEAAVDLLTTNETYFWREPQQLRAFEREIVPMLGDALEAQRCVRVLSAGCSTGEEPYTLAMVLNEVAASQDGFSYQIMATDISTRVLEKARKAVYDEDRIDPVPMQLRRKYLLRSKDRTSPQVRIVPELRSRVRFSRLNFMDSDFGFRDQLDIIFCRNVIIYFDRKTQERLLNKFHGHLRAGGWIFMGHSETLNGLDVPLVQVHPTVYRKLV